MVGLWLAARMTMPTMSFASSSAHVYPTDLTDAQWALAEPVLTERHGPGRPPQLDRRRILNGLLYLERTGCQWRLLPKEFGHWETVRYYFDRWTQDGTLEHLHTRLRERARVAAGRAAQPSAAIIDSQSVKTTEAAEAWGFDGAKKSQGRKRHLLTDTLGLPLRVHVTTADEPDADGGLDLLVGARRVFPRLALLWADGAYQGGFV